MTTAEFNAHVGPRARAMNAIKFGRSTDSLPGSRTNSTGADMSQSDEHLTMVEDCEKRESKLSDWERTFIDSLRAQLESDGALTARQAETLDSIWERIT